MSSTAEINRLTRTGARSLRPRRQQAWFLPRSIGDSPLPAPHVACDGLLVLFGVPWLIEASSLSLALSLCDVNVFVYVQISPSHKDTII